MADTEKRNRRARLIIVCGLPGSGKTTRATFLESKLGAIRFSADEWLKALSLDLWDEDSRGKSKRSNGTLGNSFSLRASQLSLNGALGAELSAMHCGLAPEN